MIRPRFAPHRRSLRHFCSVTKLSLRKSFRVCLNFLRQRSRMDEQKSNIRFNLRIAFFVCSNRLRYHEFENDNVSSSVGLLT